MKPAMKQYWMKNMKKALLSILPALLLSACGTPPRQPDAVVLTPTWQQAHVKDVAEASAAQRVLLPVARWWAALGDEQLTQLIDDALARNTNVARAAWRVRSARLSAGNAAAGMWPSPSASVDASRRRRLDGEGATTRSAGASVGLNWELDLWGRLAAQADEAAWEAIATEYDREAAAQALVATVAKSYWRIALLDAQIAAQRQSIETARKTLQLVQVQLEAGAVSPLEVAQSDQALASQQASLEDMLATRQSLRHALAIIFDVPPELLPAAAQSPRLPDSATLPQIVAGVPAHMLARRPDLRAAELRLCAALEGARAASRAYYPRLSLTGALGTASQSLSNVLDHPVLTLGVGLTLPFIDYARLKRNEGIAHSSYEQAIISFREALYGALVDVEDALSARTHLLAQEQALARSLAQARRAEELTEVRWQAGAVSMSRWLDAQETRRRAQTSLLNIHYERAANLADTYQALGGDPVLPEVDPPQQEAAQTSGGI